MNEIWEPQDSESPTSYAKFLEFVNMPAAERSLKNLSQKLGVTPNSLAALSSKYNWFARATAYDCRVQHNGIRADFADRVSEQKTFYDSVRAKGLTLIDIADKALREHSQSTEPLSLSMALRMIEIGFKLYGIGVRIGENKSDVESAINTLVESGYLPDRLIDQLVDNIEEMKSKNQSLFQKEVSGSSIFEVVK